MIRNCAACGTEFTARSSKHVRCSSTCNERAYTLRHPERRTASRLKYEASLSEDTKKTRSRRNALRKHGWTEREFVYHLERQAYKCAGCTKDINQETARIDHNHKTGTRRGLLCDFCNWSIGHARESRATLYQLAAYLELDRTRPVVYLVGSLRNPRIPEIANQIRSEVNVEVVDNWFAAGKIADDSWQEYSTARGRTYKEALESREAQHVFYFDKAYIELSDAVVLVAPFGKSGALEFGYARGRGKRGYILVEDIPERYDVMMQFAGSPMFHTRDNLITTMKNELTAALPRL